MTASYSFTIALPALHELAALNGVATEMARSLAQLDLGLGAALATHEQLRSLTAIPAAARQPLSAAALMPTPIMVASRLTEELQATMAAPLRAATTAIVHQALASAQSIAAAAALETVASARATVAASAQQVMEAARSVAASSAQVAAAASAQRVAATLGSLAAAQQQQMAQTLRGLAPYRLPDITLPSMPVTLALSARVMDHLAHLGQVSSGLQATWQISYSEQAQDYAACARAEEAVYADDHEAILHFTVDVLKLPARVHPYVAEALWQGRWRHADRPLGYIRRVAWYISESVERGRPSRRSKQSVESPMESLLFDTDLQAKRSSMFYNPLPAVELRIDLERACAQPGIPPDVYQLLQARMQGVTRAEAGVILGWTPQRVESAWRWVSRNRQRLANILHLTSDSCPQTQRRSTHGK